MLLIVNYSFGLLSPEQSATKRLLIEAVAANLAARFEETASETFVTSFCPLEAEAVASGIIAHNIRAQVSRRGSPNVSQLGLFIPLHKLSYLQEKLANDTGSLAGWLVELSNNYNRRGELLLQMAGLVEDETEFAIPSLANSVSLALASTSSVYPATNPLSPLVSPASVLVRSETKTGLEPVAHSAFERELITQWGDAGTVIIIPPQSPVLNLFLGHALTHLLTCGDIISPVYIVSSIEVPARSAQEANPGEVLTDELNIKLEEWD